MEDQEKKIKIYQAPTTCPCAQHKSCWCYGCWRRWSISIGVESVGTVNWLKSTHILHWIRDQHGKNWRRCGRRLVAHSLVEANCRGWKPFSSLLFSSVCTELKKLAMANAGAMSTQDGFSMLVRWFIPPSFDIILFPSGGRLSSSNQILMVEAHTGKKNLVLVSNGLCGVSRSGGCWSLAEDFQQFVLPQTLGWWVQSGLGSSPLSKQPCGRP